jgi:DNA-binding transcriptional regulator YiaG
MATVLTDSSIRGLILANNAKVRALASMPPQSEWRALRLRHGLRQKDFGGYVGVTQGAVAQWEQGLSRPGPEHLPRIARLMEILMEDAA